MSRYLGQVVVWREGVDPEADEDLAGQVEYLSREFPTKAQARRWAVETAEEHPRAMDSDGWEVFEAVQADDMPLGAIDWVRVEVPR